MRAGPRRAAIRLLVAALIALALPAAALGGSTTRGVLTASDGQRIEYFVHGPARAPALLISPAFTGSARLYADRFGRALPRYRVVAVSLRGHGTAGGCRDRGRAWCAPTQPPGRGVYAGFRMPRLAADLHEVRGRLGLGRVALMGHSIGMNVVAEYISDHGTDGLTGLFVYDQSPKNLAEGVPADPSFPPGIATYPTDRFTALVASLARFAPGRGYLNVPRDLRLMLGGPTGDPVLDPARPAPAFLLEQSRWREWMRFAGRLNGKALSLLFWSTITQDYTDVYRVVRASGIPVLVYGGRSSIVPWQAMRWVHRQLPGSELMLFGPRVGVHGAFLNPPPSGEVFMDRLRGFLDRRVRPRA
jgi:pimeloyl-ACP methyl ester carboxylesterase